MFKDEYVDPRRNRTHKEPIEIKESNIKMDKLEFVKYVEDEYERQWNENQKEEFGEWSKQDDDTKAEYYNDMYKQKITEE